MTALPWTKDQKVAIAADGRSVVVSAAAGSGKTAVLAERCAHLVCDEPRCGVEELLVVTFTEAAAAEMKARIRNTIRARLADHPDDGHLRTQAALIETAQISTIHSFCNWIMRRWFEEADVDPAVVVLGADEAELLLHETRDDFFDELYGRDDPFAEQFRALVEHYGLGRDCTIATTVLRLAEFLRSLPDPQQWVARARSAVGDAAEDSATAHEDWLRKEIDRQRDQVDAIAEHVKRLPDGSFHGGKLDQYAAALRRWSAAADVQSVREEILAFEMTARGAPRRNALKDAATYAAAKALFEQVRDKLLKERLWRLALWSREDVLAGLAAVAPYVDCLCGLATELIERYAKSKREQDTVDFADLERIAFDVLRGESDDARGSDVAHAIRDRFAYVLVDEFQDISPLQEALLNLVSRECDPGRAGNLFCVGDIKQSIYRFRLAEPELFQTRVGRADGEGPGDAKCIRLQENFRSTEALIDAVNLLFERLMTRELGGVDYDERSRLRFGGKKGGDQPAHPVELHLIERTVDADASDDDDEEAESTEEPRKIDPDDPAVWEVIEREACLIGRRILALRDPNATPAYGWSDIAILLRSPRYRVQALADVLERMGVPTSLDGGDALHEATEVRDVLALLQVLDNLRQDIPMASVLRSGIAGAKLTEDELLEIRLRFGDVPFHEAVLRCADGKHEPGGENLRRIFDRVHRWRDMARRRPVADVLWTIYGQSGYLAYVGGLRRGRLQRANLLALHERARQFGDFRRQGLHRFLRFIESLEEVDERLAGPPVTGHVRNAVRILSIHGSKGLEFPVVFVADLNHRFNFEDCRRRIIFDRREGLGLRVVEPDRMIEYPSAQHRLAAESMAVAARDEELRVLYVALTRAKERLILVGTTSLDKARRERDQWRGQTAEHLPLATARAGTALDWVLPALATAGDRVRWSDEQAVAADSLYEVQLHAAEDVRQWSLEERSKAATNATRRAAACLEGLPPDEPVHDDAEAACALERVRYTYPHLAAASVRAVVPASEAKRLADPAAEDEQRAVSHLPAAAWAVPDVLAESPAGLTPQQRGTAIHRVMEHLDFGRDPRQELRRMVEAGLLSPEEAGAVDLAGVEWFLSQPLGRRIAEAGARYRRELSFIAAESPGLFEPGVTAVDDRVLVRGMVDGVLESAEALEVIDFKTDAVDHEGAARRAEEYRMQMRLYAQAVSRLYGRSVRGCSLVFLTARRIIELPGYQEAP